MGIKARRFTNISVGNKNKNLFFNLSIFQSFNLSIIFFLLTINLSAQVIIKEKVEINPQRTIQPENGIGGDTRNPVYLRYGGDVTVRQNRAVNGSYELWEETLGKIADVALNGTITEVGIFPQWQKLIFYIFNPSTNQKYYPLLSSSSVVGEGSESGWLEFHPSYVPGEPLPWDADFVWLVFIDADYSLASMPPPEILDELGSQFQPTEDLTIPLPGNLYAIVTSAVTQEDALWIDKPSTQLIMDELGSHIDDTLFFGQMNVGDTLRFFLRSPNTVVSGMNLYPTISTYERMMPGGEIFMCRLDFEDWTDQLFDDVSIEIYLQPDSGAYAGPIAIFFEPEQIGPRDTTTITFKLRHLDGTLEDIDSLRTFEVGLLDGCTLGILKTETDSGVYISSTYQPLIFIADSSADSGTVLVRAGLIDEGGSSKMIRGNIEQEQTTETKTAKRYDVIINKNTPNGYAQRNNNQVLGDNPGSEFCQLEYYTQTFGLGSFGVGDGCGNLDLCTTNNAGKKPAIEVIDLPNGFDGTDHCQTDLAHLSEKGHLIGGFFTPFWSKSDNFLWIKYNEEKLFFDYQISLCYDQNADVVQFGITTDKLLLKTIVAVCEDQLIERGFTLINNEAELKTKVPQDITILRTLYNDLEIFRKYGEGRGQYLITEMLWAHELKHNSNFKEQIVDEVNKNVDYLNYSKLDVSCSQVNNLNEVVEIMREAFDKKLEEFEAELISTKLKKWGSIANNATEYQKKTAEFNETEETHNKEEVQNVITRYKDAIIIILGEIQFGEIIIKP